MIDNENKTTNVQIFMDRYYGVSQLDTKVHSVCTVHLCEQVSYTYPYEWNDSSGFFQYLLRGDGGDDESELYFLKKDKNCYYHID